MQVIISTQSVPLVDQFELEDLIIVERDKDGTKFKKLEIQEYEGWLEDYSTGELWEKIFWVGDLQHGKSSYYL